jgi:hypothetical protein
MRIAKYRLTVRHDNGTVNIETQASSEDAAVQAIMNAERCPRRSITEVQEIGVIYDSGATTFYRQHPDKFRVCVNCGKSRGSHIWSDTKRELLCIEPPEPEAQIELLTQMIRSLIDRAQRVQDEANADIYTDAPECAAQLKTLNVSLVELQEAMDQAKTLIDPAHNR